MARSGKLLSVMALEMVLRRMKIKGATVLALPFATEQLSRNAPFPSEVAEMALAHTVSDKTVAAYNRSDPFGKRRRLMAAWATFCTAPEQKAQSNVAPLPKQASRSTDRPRLE